MLTQLQKSVLARPMLGLPPGVALGGAVICVLGGLYAAMTLDKWSRAQHPVGLDQHAADSGPVPVFERPDTGITRAAVGDDALSWVRNAAPFPDGDLAPRLAIIVLDDGSDVSAARSVMRLSAPVSIAIAPTADSAEKTAIAARSAGREVMLLLPMQSESHFDVTPNPIAINVPRPELTRRMNWNLAQFDGYVGVMNQYGEAATRDPQTMRTVLESVKAEGLAFVDARTHPDSVAGAVARRMGIPAGDRNVAIDPGADTSALSKGLASAMDHARRWGTAVITIPAERRLLAALAEWLPQHDPAVKIAPVTAVIKRLRSGR